MCSGINTKAEEQFRGKYSRYKMLVDSSVKMLCPANKKLIAHLVLIYPTILLCVLSYFCLGYIHCCVNRFFNLSK